MDLRWARGRALAVGVDAVLLLVLVLLSLWLGGRVIDAVYVNNPKVNYVAPEADQLVTFAWVATALQICTAALWRRWPQLTWLVAAVMLVAHVITLHRLMELSPHPVRFAPLVPSDGVLLLALYGLTRGASLRSAVGAGGLTMGLALYSVWAGPGDLALLTGVLLVALTVTVFAAGLASRSHASYLAAMTQRAADLELARRRDAELATVAERSRLAREIHDTVAHALGIVVAQAQGASAAQANRPEETAKALNAIIGVGRQALAEMRGLLTAHSTLSTASEVLPRLGLADVTSLADQFRESGCDVEVVVKDMPAVLPPQMNQTIYRIVQESLTNAAKHASPDAAILVEIWQHDDAVQVEVCSSRAVGAPGTADGRGYGLQGMRERVLLLGGQLSAGPDESGNFLVRASIPLRGPR